MSKSIRQDSQGRSRTNSAGLLVLAGMLLIQSSLYAQTDPWSNAATKMGTIFAGPIARGFGLVAIVLGGIGLAISDGTGKKAIGGIIFGLGMALSATSFMAWLIS